MRSADHRHVRPERRGVTGVVVAMAAAGSGVVLHRSADASLLQIGDGVAFVAVAVLAVLACARRALGGADERSAWWLLALSAALELASRWMWWTHLHVDVAMSTDGPGLHVAAALFAAAGIWRLRAPLADKRAVRRTGVDASIVLVASLLVATRAVFATAAAAGATDSVVRYASVATATDVVLATMALVVLSCARYPGGARLRVVLPLSIGLVGLAAGDAGSAGATLVGGARLGGTSDLLVTAGLVALVVAAWERDAAEHAALMPRRERIAVCAAIGPVVVAALAVAGYQLTAGTLPDAIAVWVTALGGLLLLRLIVALLDNLVLSRTLEAQVAERTLELVTREQWFRSLVQHSSDVVCVIDPSGVIRYQSPAAERLFGHTASGTVGSTLMSLVAPGDLPRMHAALGQAIGMAGASFVLDLRVRHVDDGWRDTETVVTSLLDVPDVHGVVLNIRDVTERKQLQQRLEHQAYHDTLTGLGNRALFQRELATRVGAPEGSVAVLFCDLDGFKAVNDSQGHDVGDALLRLVSERLRGCVRPSDVVARFGGDEFAILVESSDAMLAAQQVADSVARALSAPFDLDGREARVGVSIGIASVGPGADSVEVLLRNADLAMYRAKADRTQSVAVYEPAMHDALLARLELEDALRSALGSGQLVLHYQPTVELDTGLTIGVEALMRWYRPGRGVVSPQQFIAIAEENGFIDAMGQWALFEACRQGATWQAYAAPGTTFSVGVNISARQVTPALIDLVAAALGDAGLPPSALLLEMTESVLLERTDEAVAVLRSLKRLGVRLAIDDFGTGFSSLSYLSRFPVDVLKIDKTFIDAVDGGGEKAELARTIVDLGRNLGLTTIAEGVERLAQVHALRAIDCAYGQGYLFGRAVPANAIGDLLQVEHGGQAPAGAVPIDQLPVPEQRRNDALDRRRNDAVVGLGA